MDEKPIDQPQSHAETFSDSPPPLSGRSVGLSAAEKDIKIARRWLLSIGLLTIGGAIYLWWPLQMPPDFGFVMAVAKV
jgi:hypothetical protein